MTASNKPLDITSTNRVVLYAEQICLHVLADIEGDNFVIWSFDFVVFAEYKGGRSASPL